MTKLTKTEKKIRIRTGKRVKQKLQTRIPSTNWGTKIMDALLAVEKHLRTYKK